MARIPSPAPEPIASRTAPCGNGRSNGKDGSTGTGERLSNRSLPALSDEYTAWLITSLARRLTRNASSHYTAGWGIGSTEYRLLMAIGRAGPCSAVHAAAAADIDKAAASRSMKLLLEAGLIETVRIGRRSETQLTEDGRSLHATLVEQTRRRDGRLTHGMSAEEIARLRADLRRLIDNLPYMNAE